MKTKSICTLFILQLFLLFSCQLNFTQKKLTLKQIRNMADGDLELSIIDNIDELLGDDYENEYQNFLKLTKGQQAIYSTWILEGEVNNGGFNQFYFNSSGQYAAKSVEGLQEIGALKYMKLVKEANRIYVANRDKLEKFDDGTLEGFSESYKNNPLNPLDNQFYELDKVESLSELRIDYIRKHVEEFIDK